MRTPNLHDEIVARLLEQGISKDPARELASVIVTEMLTWRDDDPGDPDTADAILAFSFGNRMARTGNHSPGPVNETLSDIVESHYQRRPRQIYAQWEIAESLIAKDYPVHAIYPSIHRDRPIGCIYLNSEEVLASAVALGLKKGPVFVVAHRHHLQRCAAMVRQRQLRAITAPGEMPFECDSESGQLWTAGVLTSLVSEIISRLSTVRKNQLYPKHPSP